VTQPMSKIVAEFQIEYIQYLQPDGEPIQALPAFANDIALLQDLYKWMLRTRIFDQKAIALQRTGRLGTYPSSQGQEAIAVAIGKALRPDDVMCGYYREFGAHLQRGVKMEEIFQFWGGDERGSCFEHCIDFPHAIPIASQYLHGAGVAAAFKLRDEPRCALTIVGDGGTSEGDFYEAINVAGCWDLPLICMINNNQWAISVPLKEQTRTQTLAQKGIAAGMDCLQVDGNDVIAVLDVLYRALEKARRGEGPTLIEAITYRLGDHTTADDARRYRDEAEVEQAKEAEPLIRMRRYLEKQHAWSEQEEQAWTKTCQDDIEAAVERYVAIEPQPVTAMFDYLYGNMPKEIQEQREQALMYAGTAVSPH